MEVSGLLHAPTALPAVPLNRRLGKPQNWYGHCLDRVWNQRRIILLGQRNHGGYEGLGMCDWDEATRLYRACRLEKPLENIHLEDPERDTNKSLRLTLGSQVVEKGSRCFSLKNHAHWRCLYHSVNYIYIFIFIFIHIYIYYTGCST